MVTLDNLVVTMALPVIRDDLGASLEELEWTVNAYTLTFAVLLLTGAALGDRFGRRRMFVDRARRSSPLASAAAALAPSIETLVVARAIQGVGARDGDAADADAPLSAAVPPAKRGARARRLGRDRRPRRRARPAGRRRGRRGHLLAVDLLAQRARSASIADPARASALSESHGPDRTLDLPGLGLVSAGLFGIVWGLVRGNGSGLDEHRGRRRRSARRVAARRVRPLGAAHAGADAADAVLPQPDVRGGERRLPVHVLRDVRLDLPARPVPPGRAGVLPARRRPADAAVDGDADLRRADRRCALRPDRRTAVDGVGLALQASALGWLAAVTEPTSPYSTSSRRS